MSKDRRQKRFLQKDRHIERQVTIALTNEHDYFRDDVNRHKLHKRHAMNCGKPTCLLCMNPRKAFGEKTMQEVRHDIYCQVVDSD